MKKILVVCFFILFFLRGFAANKYFSAAGNDANTGTTSSPWRTVQKLNSIFTTLLPGDSVLFRRGDTFYGGISITKSGTVGAPIVIGAYGTGNRPIITGLSSLTGWTSAGTNIWLSSAIATLPTYLNSVVQNDALVAVGRYPNKSASPSTGGYLTISSAVGNNQLTINSLLNTPNFTGAWGVVRVNNPSIQYRQISSHVGTQVNFASSFYTNLIPGFGMFFINSLLTLDSTSEWYYNPTTKRIYWYSVSAPVGVEAATITNLVMSTNFSYITFDNINFRGSNEASLDINGGTGFKIQNCNVNFSGVSGIEMANHNSFLIQYDSIYHTQNESIRINGTTGGNVLDNVIYKSGHIVGMAQVSGGVGRMNGIAVVGNNITIKNNSIKRSGYGGIRWDGNNITVRENLVDTFCYVANDGGGLYTQGATIRTGNTVVKNIVMNAIGAAQGTNLTSPQSYGIYLDNNASNILVDSNSVAYTAIDYFLHGGSGNTFTNNTAFSNNFGFHAWQQNAGSPIRNIIVKKNIWAVKNTTGVPTFYRSYTTDIGSFATTLDSNYYVKSLGTISSPVVRNEATNITLPMWKTAYPAYDAATVLSPVYVTNISQIQFIYNATGTATVNPLTGSWIDAKSVSYSGSITLQPYTSALLINTGTLTTPTITWPNPSAKTYPNPLISADFNHTANVPGTFADNYAAGTVLNASGTPYTLSTIFTPTNQTLYTTATKSVPITINKGTASLSYSAPTLTQTWTGLPLAPTVVTSPAGLPYNITYNNVGATPIDTGTYVIRAAVNSPNYQSVIVVGSFRINPAPASITVSNIVQQYDSTLKQVSVVTSPVGLAYTITSPKRYKGTYAVVVTLNDPNHTASVVNTTLTITAGVTSVAWTPLSPITHPTPIGASQLNYTSPKAGVFTPNPISGTVLTVGTQPLKVDFVPSDTNIAPIIGTVRDIVVNKGTTTLTITDTIQFADGSPKFITAIAGQPSGTVTVNYTGAHTAVGDYPFSVTYIDANWQATTVTGTLHIISNAANIFITNYSNRVYTGSPIDVTVTSPYSYTLVYNPSNHTNVNNNIQVIATINDGIHTGADTVTMTIIKATPTTSWPAISNKTYPFTLSGSELNLTSPTLGAATYNPLLGTALSVGTHIITGTWTPTDVANYNIVVVSNTITVNKGTATINASNFNQDYDATAKSVTASTTPANLNLIITYNISTTPPTNAGSYSVNIILADSNYVATPVNGTLIINKINAVLTFPTPAAIPVGTALSSIQLQASSNVAGTFTYVPGFGSVPPAGTGFIIATFHPSDSVNYNTTSISVPLSVFGSPILNYYIRHGNIIYIETP